MIRIPNLTDLSDKDQVRELLAVLHSIRNDLSRTAMPIETKGVTSEMADDPRFRVVNRDVSPSDSTFDSERTHDIQFFVGKKWLSLKLEGDT